MQITRERVRPAVEMQVEEVCPTCGGKGKIQPSILFTDTLQEQIEHEFNQHGRGLQLHLHPFIYAYVTRGFWRSLAGQWRRKYGIKVLENQSLGMLETRFIAEK